jgi:hypothetical protein
LSTPALKWEPGTALVYALDYRQEGTLPAAADARVAGKAHLAGELRVEVLSGPQAPVLEVRFAALRVAQWEWAGSDAGAHEAFRGALEGGVAWVETTPQGAVVAVRVHDESSRPVGRIVDRLFRQLQVLGREPAHAETWTTVVDTGFGRCPTRFEVRSGPHGDTIGVSRDARQCLEPAPIFGGAEGEISGQASATLSLLGGVVERAQSRERVQIGGESSRMAALSDALDLKLLSVRRGTPRPAEVADKALATAPSARAQENAWALRAAGLTFEQLMADLELHGAGGRMPQHDKWLWRATGLLRLHPERAQELAEFCLRQGTPDAARALAVDLLVNVGHAHAQSALRAVLTSAELRQAPAFGGLLQRTGLLASPEPATVGTVLGLFREPASAAERRAVSATLGAMAQRSAGSPEHRAAASAAVDALLEALPAAEGDDARALVTGLGNAAPPAGLEPLLAASMAPEPGLRAASARALRSYTDESSGVRLAELMGDTAPAVQQAALSALRERERMSPAALRVLAALVASGAVADDSAPGLIRLVAQWQGEGALEGLDELALALSARPWQSPQARHAAAALVSPK